MKEQPLWYKRRWLALGFLSFSLLVIALDNTVLSMALPSISRQLGSTASELQWIVDSYVLVFAAFLLMTGSIGDRIGRKKMLQIGMVFFFIFSLGSALARSTGILIGMRAIMGLGGAIIMPSTLSILTATFREPKERAQAIALWAATFALGLGLGPLIGGVLIQHFGWSSVFYINLPIVVIGMVGGNIFIHESKDENPRKIDIPGALLSITGLFALVYGIIEAGMNGWTSSNVIYSFIAAVVLLGGFAYWEWRSPNAMLPISFFKNMSFTGANLALTLVAFALMGSVFFISQFFQSVQDYTPLQAGIRILPNAITSFIASALSARFASKFGTKIAVATGIFVAACGLFYLSRVAHVDTSYNLIVIGQIILAAGIGITMSPATNSIMGSVPVRKAGIGSAMNDTTRQIGGALGIAVLGTLMNSTYINKIDTFQKVANLPEQLYAGIRSSIQGAHIIATKIPDQALSTTIINQANQAFVEGMNYAMLVASIVMIIASMVTLIILPAKIRPSIQEYETVSEEIKSRSPTL